MTTGSEREYIPPLLAELSARVRTALLSSGVTQAMLARRLGVSEKHVSRVLNGRDDGSLPLWDAMLREAQRPREDGEKGNRPAGENGVPTRRNEHLSSVGWGDPWDDPIPG